MIEVEKSKNGSLTLKYENRYVHSKYDPIIESEQFASGNLDLIKKPIILLYGLGLGYHIDAIVKKMNSDSILYVFEWNKILVDYCKEVNGTVFKYKNVKIIENNDKDFYKKLAKCLEQAKDILIHKPSLETIITSNETLYNLINDYSIVKQYSKIDLDTINLSEENFEANKEQKYNMINEFIEKYRSSNKPYVIAAAGPSLDDELDLLKEYREQVNIISVGSALRALMNKGIKPDVVVIIDGHEIVKKQFEGYENENIPLCFSATASRWAVGLYNGPKYIFNLTEEDELVIKTRGTVAVAAIDIAIKCGAKNIIFLGQDLAFLKDRSHTKAFEEVYGFKDEDKKNTKWKTVMGVDGEFLNTRQSYITFKNKIESLIREYKNVKFVNCSKGAFINGADHMDFKSNQLLELLEK
ncbi:hypothetical protein CLPUN_34530 [Clostridium puniceum]|uniref:6-hydroxymethylpterin diphosphokinase MptE-like domain-containing protein n=1 Tax=Clostridium puniceum TaxID=29367 RepID=A0A1S8TBA4_9CLOT|nr:6-hydroxymethylpterin diphosphokinase MptE-like protein [Clostridium puniceum]OOM75016.1 hypothetical protein CLPUN_34530 [Clostridium puniceum]